MVLNQSVEAGRQMVFVMGLWPANDDLSSTKERILLEW